MILRNPRFRGHGHRDFGPIRINYSTRGMTSWSLRLGRLSWNSRSRKWKFNTPGFGYMDFDGPPPPLSDKVDEYAARLPRRRSRRRN